MCHASQLGPGSHNLTPISLVSGSTSDHDSKCSPSPCTSHAPSPDFSPDFFVWLHPPSSRPCALISVLTMAPVPCPLPLVVLIPAHPPCLPVSPSLLCVHLPILTLYRGCDWMAKSNPMVVGSTVGPHGSDKAHLGV